MEKMWLRLPRLCFFFIQKQIISRPSCNAFPVQWGVSLLSTFPQGPTLCNAPYAPVSIHLFLSHSRTVSPSFAFHGGVK